MDGGAPVEDVRPPRLLAVPEDPRRKDPVEEGQELRKGRTVRLRKRAGMRRGAPEGRLAVGQAEFFKDFGDALGIPADDREISLTPAPEARMSRSSRRYVSR